MAAKDAQFIEALSVLSEEVRFRILSLIASKGELAAKDILEKFDFTQPTLSHHMACLAEAGLVNVKRKGRYLIRYTLSLEETGPDSRELVHS